MARMNRGMDMDYNMDCWKRDTEPFSKIFEILQNFAKMLLQYEIALYDFFK